MAIAGSDQSEPRSLRVHARGMITRVAGLFTDGSDHSIARKAAGSAFLIRVAGAGIAFFSQVVLARWMGQHDFGIYVYVWTWLLLIGSLAPLGLCTAAQRFIPEYSAQGDLPRLRGYLFSSRLICFGIGSIFAVLSIALIYFFQRHLESHYLIPLIMAAICLPMHALSAAHDGIARSYNWIDLALAPGYIVRPIAILAVMAMFYLAGFPATAAYAMISTVVAYWVVTSAQLLFLNRRLRGRVAPGPRKNEIPFWLVTAFPIFLVESFYFLLTYTDILVLELFVKPEEVAVYYAATKVLALVAFVYFAVSAATAHRFAEYHVNGEREKLEHFLSESIKWTFWPSLAGTMGLLAVGHYVLALFGPGFSSGYGLLYALAVGLLARSAVGPVERLLNMVGEQKACAVIYASAFIVNLVLCFVLIPYLGTFGAALATSCAMLLESVALFVVTKRKLGLHVFIFGAKI